MINIGILDLWVDAQKLINPSFNTNTFTIQLGEPGFEYFSISNAIHPNDPTSPMQQGGPSMVILRPYEEFDIGDEEFANLVSSAKNGGSTDFITGILYLVRKGVIQVNHNGVVLTPSQILNFTV